MKPHIPLILLSALLATAPVKANLAEMETIPGHPAFIPDYDYFIVENDPSPSIALITKVGCFFAEQPRIYQQYDFRAMAFYKRDANMLALYGGSIESLAGSIILKDVLLIGTSLTTKADGIEDAVWGLPQVAIDGVVFGTSVISVKSNYCTIRNWSGEATNFLLGNTGASFEGGKATGNIQIHSNKDVKVRNLSITNGSLNILDTAATTYGDWVVELNNIHADNGITVQAKSGRGLINVGPIVDSKIGIMHSFTAKEVNFSALANCNIKVQASESVSFADFVKANTLEVLPNNQTRADITFADSLIATSSIKLQGKAIQGTNADAVISASSYQIDASDEVRIQGTFQGGDLTLTAGGAVTLGSLGSLEKPLDSATITGNSALPVNMQSFRGRTLDITTGGAVYVDTIVSSDEQKKRTTINAGGSVNLGSFQGNELRFDAGGDVNLGSFQGEVLWFGAKGNAIYVGSIGSLEHPVYDAIIGDSNTTASVTVDSFHCREEDGVLTIESKGVITIGKEREQGSGGAGLPVNEGQVTLRYYGEGRGDEVWDVQVIGEVRGELYVTAHSGRVDVGHITGIGEIAAKDIHVSSFEGSDLELNARKNATVLGNIDATGSLIIKPDKIYESGYADIYIQTDETVQAKTISMQGKDIVSDSAKVVFTAEGYDIGATGEITFAGRLQGGKIDMTAAGNISLNAVGSSGDPVGTTHITSTEGDITLNSYQGGGLLMSAGGTLNIVKELAISTGFVEVETASGAQDFSAYLKGASVNIGCDLADNENGYGLYVEATGTQETDTGITISGDLDAGKSGKADQLKSAKDINLNGLTSGFLQAEAAGTVTFGGDVQVAGSDGQKASFRAGDEVVFNRTAELTDVDMRAPKVTLGSETTATRLTLSGDAGETPAQVTFGDELTLKDQSRIEGNVASSQSDAAITVENSTITGTVSRIGTVNLVNGIIGSAEQFSTLTVQSASQITSDLVLSNDATLSFILGTHNLNSPVLTIGGEMKADITEDFSFTINLAGNKLPVLQKYALITTTNKAQAPDFWKSPNVRVSGLSSDPETLFWEDGTLYFSLGGPELEVATWIGEQSRAWNTEDFNWKQGDNTY